MHTGRTMASRRSQNKSIGAGIRDGIHHAREGQPSLSPVEAPCECTVCQRGEFRSKEAQTTNPYEGIQNQQISRAVVEGLATHLFELREVLEMIVAAHGSTLVKRWRRKTYKQRHDSLKAFEPQLCPQDHYALRDEVKMWDEDVIKGWDPDVMGRTRHLLPYVNLERLSADSWRLLGLIYHRTNSEPSEFAIMDARILMTAWAVGNLPHMLYQGSAIMHGDEYGRWKTLDLAQVHRGLEFSASKAFLVLQSQGKLLCFLIGIATHILSDRVVPFKLNRILTTTTQSPDNMGSVRANIFETLQYHTTSLDHLENQKTLKAYVEGAMISRTKNMMHNLISSSEFMPFLGPPMFDIDHLLELARERVIEAHDELELLQTDPSYLLRRLRQLESRTIHKIQGASASQEFDKWTDIINCGIWDSVHSYTEWSAVVQELEHVKAKRTTSWTSILPNHPLPQEYDTALACLFFMAKTMQRRIRARLQQRALSMPAVQQHVRCHNQIFKPGTHTMLYHLTLRHGAAKKLEQDPILLLFIQICTEQDNLYQYNLPQSLYFLDQAMSIGSRTEIAHLDPFVYALFSDLAVLEEIVIACELHRPTHKVLQTEACLNTPRPYWQGQKAVAENPDHG